MSVCFGSLAGMVPAFFLRMGFGHFAYGVLASGIQAARDGCRLDLRNAHIETNGLEKESGYCCGYGSDAC